MDKQPKAFISYAWTNNEHERWVLMLAESLCRHGVDVVIDKWDLKEGHDKYMFMEQMVNSSGIDKVLIICDKRYSEKANYRSGGVGDETIIITPEVYRNAKQEKFIPIVVEKDIYGEPCLPVYLKTKMYIDMSNKDLFNKSYEQLLRSIHNLPLYSKPTIGSIPVELLKNRSALTQNQIFEFAKDTYIEIESNGIDNKSKQINLVDTKKPIIITQIGNEERIESECIANVSFHPTEDCIAYSLDTRLMVHRMNKPFSNVIGNHTVTEDGFVLDNYIKEKNLQEYEADKENTDLIGTSFDYTGIEEYLNRFTVPITDIVFSNDGRFIVSADRNGYLTLWYYEMGIKPDPLIICFQAHTDAISSIRFSPKSDILATASFDETIKIWNVNSLVSKNINPIKVIIKDSNKNKPGKYRHEKEYITALAFSAHGDFIASGDEAGRIKIRDVYTTCQNDIVYKSYVFNSAVTDIKFSPVNDNIIIASSADSRIRVLRKIIKWESPETLGLNEKKHTGCVNSIALSYDGKILISSGSDSMIKIWDIESKELIGEYNTGHLDSIHKVAFCPNKNKFASDSFWDSIKLWELTNDGCISNTTVDIQKENLNLKDWVPSAYDL